MPRNGRGGARQGNPGTPYPNRTDLAANPQPVAAKTGQTYGEAGRQTEAQRQIPLPDLASMIAGLPGLTAPSQRPGEPLTAGLATGPGPGPSALAAGPGEPGGIGLLRAMYAANPSRELSDLLAWAERSRGGYGPGMLR